MINGQIHKKFILQQKKDIDDLVIGNAANNDLVMGVLQTLCQIKTKYDLALRESYEAAQKDPKLQNQESCPGEGWEWVCKNPADLAALDKRNLDKNGWVKVPKEISGPCGNMCFWTQKLPFDPASWILYYYGDWQDGIWLGPKPKEPPTLKERLACEYALFVIIHDNAREIPDCDRFIRRENLSFKLWADLLWVAVKSFGYEGKKRTYDERQMAIRSALDHVKQDMARHQPPKGGEPIEASGGKAGDAGAARRSNILTDIQQVEISLLSLYKKLQKNQVRLLGKDIAETVSYSITTLVDKLRLCSYDREADIVNAAYEGLLRVEMKDFNPRDIMRFSVDLNKPTKEAVQRLLERLTDVQDIVKKESSEQPTPPSGKEKGGQTEEQQLAARIINDLNEWISVGASDCELVEHPPDEPNPIPLCLYCEKLPKGYRPNHCLEYRLSIHNKLGINPIILKLESDGKGDLAKRIERLRDELNAEVENDKNLPPTSPMHLPDVGLHHKVGNLINSLKSALPCLEAQTAKDTGTQIQEKLSQLNRTLEQVKADLASKQQKQAEKLTEANISETNLPVYRNLNLANRIITIGIKTYSITSERVWDFVKDLCTAFKQDRIVPTYEGAVKNKNAVDQLRRLLGKENLHNFIVFVKGGYKLKPEVKILNSGQVGIRKTRLKKAQATLKRHTSDFSKNS